MAQSKFPQTLVLPINKVLQSGSTQNSIVEKINQGSTFSIPFDMSNAPQEPLTDGLVYMMDIEQSNFKANSKVQMSNEGLSNKIGFMSIEDADVEVFGEKAKLTRVFLVGTPNGDVFTWETGVILNDEIILVYSQTSNIETIQSLLK